MKQNVKLWKASDLGKLNGGSCAEIFSKISNIFSLGITFNGKAIPVTDLGGL
jgi:hypothetical protein